MQAARHDRQIAQAASLPALANNARTGHPQFRNGKEDHGKAGHPPRWLSSDWSAVPVPVPYANLTNPQTLNLYSMVADDPESFADLDGHVLGLLSGSATSQAASACAAGAVSACDSPEASLELIREANPLSESMSADPDPDPAQAENQSQPVLMAQNQDPNQSQSSSSSSSSSGRVNSPAQGQQPDTTVTIPGKKPGESTDRTYGPDGRAVKDIDSPHAHDPETHAHDWDWSKSPPRQPRRPLTPDEAAGKKSSIVDWAGEHKGALITGGVIVGIGVTILTGGAAAPALAIVF